MAQNITVFYLELFVVANYALFKTTGKGKIQKSRGGIEKILWVEYTGLVVVTTCVIIRQLKHHNKHISYLPINL